MAEVIDDEFLMSVNSYNHKDGYQKAMSTFNAYKTNVTAKANITNSKGGKNENNKKPKSKQVNDSLDHCKTSNLCKKELNSLGCIKLYELPTSIGRLNFLKNSGLCFKCGAPFHGPFKDKKRKTQWCSWTSVRKIAKCSPPNSEKCNFSAATCPCHKDNVSPELIA